MKLFKNRTVLGIFCIAITPLVNAGLSKKVTIIRFNQQVNEGTLLLCLCEGSGISLDNFFCNASSGNTAVHCLFFDIAMSIRFAHVQFTD